MEQEAEEVGRDLGGLVRSSKESKLVGERIMGVLEALDRISLGQHMGGLRVRRKVLATRLNTLLDTLDRDQPDMTLHYVEVGDIQQGLGLPGKASL